MRYLESKILRQELGGIRAIRRKLLIPYSLFLISSFLSLYTATLYSRKASFKEVFKSVLGLRWPMMRAQGT